jgi:hypothetical protein
MMQVACRSSSHPAILARYERGGPTKKSPEEQRLTNLEESSSTLSRFLRVWGEEEVPVAGAHKKAPATESQGSRLRLWGARGRGAALASRMGMQTTARKPANRTAMVGRAAAT